MKGSTSSSKPLHTPYRVSFFLMIACAILTIMSINGLTLVESMRKGEEPGEADNNASIDRNSYKAYNNDKDNDTNKGYDAHNDDNTFELKDTYDSNHYGEYDIYSITNNALKHIRVGWTRRCVDVEFVDIKLSNCDLIKSRGGDSDSTNSNCQEYGKSQNVRDTRRTQYSTFLTPKFSNTLENIKDLKNTKNTKTITNSKTKRCTTFPTVDNASEISNEAVVVEFVLWQTSFFISVIAVCLQIGIFFVYVGMKVSNDEYFFERAWKIICYFGVSSMVSQLVSLLMVYIVKSGGSFGTQKGDGGGKEDKYGQVAVRFFTMGLGLTNDQKKSMKFEIGSAWYFGMGSILVMLLNVSMLAIVGYLNPPTHSYTLREYQLLKDDNGEDDEDEEEDESEFNEDNYTDTEIEDEGERSSLYNIGGGGSCDYGSFRAASNSRGYNSITGYNGYNRYQNDEDYRRRAYLNYLDYTTYNPNPNPQLQTQTKPMQVQVQTQLQISKIFEDPNNPKTVSSLNVLESGMNDENADKTIRNKGITGSSSKVQQNEPGRSSSTNEAIEATKSIAVVDDYDLNDNNNGNINGNDDNDNGKDVLPLASHNKLLKSNKKRRRYKPRESRDFDLYMQWSRIKYGTNASNEDLREGGDRHN